jgi:hypothetical protein
MAHHSDDARQGNGAPVMTDDSRIMLIRHAEKPRDGEQAVNREGQPDADSLSITGWMRAGALVRFFSMPEASGAARHRIVRPAHLLAARPTPARPSTRPRDTLQPLARSLGLNLDLRFASEDPLPRLAEHLRRLQGSVLVCWRHDELPALANELLQRTEAPGTWPGRCYDLVWIIEQVRCGGKLTQVPQHLLPGDVSQGLTLRVGGKRGPTRVR